MNDVEYVDCPLCGPSQTKVWLDDGKRTLYVRCVRCRTVFASPRTTRAHRLAWLNNSFAVSDNLCSLTNSRRSAFARESKCIQKHVSGGRMLDVGCSVGALFESFPSSYWDRYGVELCPSAAEFAAQAYGASVHVGTIHSARFDSCMFDLVTVIDTFYYVDDPAAELREIHRIAKPGGFLAIEIPGQGYMLRRNRGLLPYILDRTWSRVGTNSSYLYWFGPHALAKLLSKYGFEPVDWCVAPSPGRSSVIARWAARCHYEVVKCLCRISLRVLTWAPKYLCIAQVRK